MYIIYSRYICLYEFVRYFDSHNTSLSKGVSYKQSKRVMVFIPTDSTFLSSIQITTIIIYCTVHVYVVIILFLIVCGLFERKLIYVGCSPFVHTCIGVGVIKRGVTDPSNHFNSITFIRLSQAKTQISNVVCRGPFYVQ